MSYPPHWTPPSVAPPGTNISAQSEFMPNANMFSSFPSTAQIRQTAPIHMRINQTHPNQNSSNFCPAIPESYPFVYSPLISPFAAHSGVVQSRQPSGLCISHPNQPNAAAAFRGSAILSALTNFQPVPSLQPPPPNQHQLTQFPYFPPFNGISLAAAFPGASATPAFPHSSLPQQPVATFLPAQLRGCAPLKRFGAQATNHKTSRPMTTSKTNLYITGLSESDTDETVRALVENVVRPKSCKAMLLNGRCKGSGFIDCATEEDAIKALSHLVEMSANGGRQLMVKYALENEKDLLNVYVRNLPRTGVTKDTLFNLFQPYGQVTSVKLLETDGAYTGIGFVRFASAEQALRAVDGMNERRCILAGGNVNGDSSNSGGAAKPICCKLADKADPKRRAAAVAAAAAAAAMGATGRSSPPSVGPPRGRFYTSRNHQPPSQQLICGDLHLQNHQRHHPIGAAISTLLPNQQLPTGFIYQPSMLTDGRGLIATPCYPDPSTEIPDASRCPPTIVTNASTGTTSSVIGFLDVPVSQSPPIDHHHHHHQQQQHYLLTQPPLMNGHPSTPVIDSRYAVHMAAAAVAASHNPVMYPPSNAIAAGTHQFPPSGQHSLVQPTYTVASRGITAHHPYGHPTPVDLTAEQLQSLTIAAATAVRQPQQFFPEWRTAGFQPPPPIGSREEGFVNRPVAAAAAAALLNSYIRIPQSMLPISRPPPPPPPPPPPRRRRSIHSTSPQMENLEHQRGSQKVMPGDGNAALVKEMLIDKDEDADSPKADGEVVASVALTESIKQKKETEASAGICKT